MAKKKSARKGGRQLKIEENQPKRIHAYMPFILAAIAVFLVLCYVLGEGETGFVGKYLKLFMTGLFSVGAYFLPALLLIHAVFYKRDRAAGSAGYKFLFSFLVLAFIGVICALINGADASFSISENYTVGKALSGGGVWGGFFYAVLFKLIGKAASWILSIAALLVFVPLVFGTTPARVFAPVFQSLRRRVRAEKTVWNENHPKEDEETLAEKERIKEENTAERVRDRNNRVRSFFRRKPKTNIVMEEGDLIKERIPEEKGPKDLEISLQGEKPKNTEQAEKKREFFGLDETDKVAFPSTKGEEPEEKEPENNYQSIFADAPKTAPILPTAPVAPEELVAEHDLDYSEKKKAKKPEPVEEKAEQLSLDTSIPEKKAYRFPPLSLLPMGNPLSDRDMSEQQATAKKLVDTLLSFGVKTNIVGISKGPRVTRYELQPQAGVRVRSIVNSADDIALALASSGVRIEAPVPGKEAAGVEVPNKTASSVYLRDSIETEEFQKSKSKLLCCLGLDISGKHIFCDLAKMPHLLVAGTTGSGKSVCLHSMILSILYHATPEEVQFILVDPKNVEFSVYNGIPHMLVPMLSDPKKAAGALNWAVIEMEKRYVLLGEEGARDIDGYNELVKNDPEKKPMSRIVIVIDELADLMMVARDEVETSICRIAQKARAAGMHLVIGTQRPSVDVVTGLIKANIPSRIALNVASQVDSRTMIDAAGAEKLLGKGDLLYKPVGALSPLRLQGSFTDEKTIRAICDFLRAEAADGYDESVMNQIEREAQRCGEKKKGSSFAQVDENGNVSTGVFDDKDELLERAIEICIAEKKFSTSLLQRRLSIGYGRAAKLGDLMADLGVIGPYNGSKPRDVVWDQTFFDEYRMRAVTPQDE